MAYPPPRSARGRAPVRAQSTLGTLQELIALSKRRPSGLNVTATVRGSLPDPTTELLRTRSGQIDRRSVTVIGVICPPDDESDRHLRSAASLE